MIEKEELDELFCKRRMLEMLDAFDQFCEKNNLSYYLAWGTLIGAVRHKGFIPWDDDIDVAMPRADYNRLIKLSENWELPYDLLCCEKDIAYPYFYGKLSDRETILENQYMENIPGQGLFVDVFPMDDVNLDENSRKAFEKKTVYTNKMLALSNMKNFWASDSVLKSAVKYVVYKYARYKGTQYWRNKLQTMVAHIMPAEGTTFDYFLCDGIVLPKKWFAGTKKLEFEGLLLSAPEDADGFLRYRYGDYMTLPPVEERVSVHDHKVYKR